MTVPVLLLDAAWRIDRVISVERACELLVTDRVVAASADVATVMRSPSIEVVIPSVVARVGRLRNGPHRLPTCSPRRVRQRDEHTCQFVIDGSPCAHRGDSVDHLVPRSRGGTNTWTNMVTACRPCNGGKADRTLVEMRRRFGWTLRRDPYVPSRSELLIASFGSPHPAWQPFLHVA